MRALCMSTYISPFSPEFWTNRVARTQKKNMIRVWTILKIKDCKVSTNEEELDLGKSHCYYCKGNLFMFCSYDCSSTENCYATLEYVWLFLLMLRNRKVLGAIDINIISIIFKYYLTGYETATTCSVIKSSCGCLFHRHCAEKIVTDTKDGRSLCIDHCSDHFPTDVICKRKVTRAGKLLAVTIISMDEYLYDSIEGLAYDCIKEVGRCKRNVLITRLYHLFKERADHNKIANILSDLVQKKQLLLVNDFYFLIKKL